MSDVQIIRRFIAEDKSQEVLALKEPSLDLILRLCAEQSGSGMAPIGFKHQLPFSGKI